MNTALKSIKRALAALAIGSLAVMAGAFALEAHAQATTTASTTGSITADVSSSTAATFGDVTLTSVDVGAETATLTWTTDVPATTQVFYSSDLSFATDNHSTPYDATLGISHTATLTGLAPGTTYYFQIGAVNEAGTNVRSDDYMFTMPAGSSSTGETGTTTGSTTGTTTGTSTSGSESGDVAALQNQVNYLQGIINTLQSEFAALQAQVQSLLNGSVGGNSGSGTGTSSGSVSGSGGSTASNGGTGSTTQSQSVSVSPNNDMVRAGTTVDFTGRGFWNNEPVNVMNGGETVAVAHADGGGNFSTGSLPITYTTGGQTYTFIGQWSGLTGSATINVTQ